MSDRGVAPDDELSVRSSMRLHFIVHWAVIVVGVGALASPMPSRTQGLAASAYAIPPATETPEPQNRMVA
jgi:hypothetical protein